MGYRERLTARTQQFVEPGETVQVAFPAQSGRSPWVIGLGGAAVAVPIVLVGGLGALGGLVVLLFTKPVVVAVTDRGIVVLRASKLTNRPAEVLRRGPHAYLGEPSGFMYTVELGGRVHVNARFHDDIRRANEIMGHQAQQLPPG